MKKLRKRILSLITAAAVAFASVTMPDIGILSTFSVPASAETQTVTKTVTWKMDGGASGETSTTPVTITARYESATAAGSASITLTVNPKSVTITGLTASNKEYDGTTTATITGTAVIDGKVGSDGVSVSAGTAAFADANAGTGKTVTFSGWSLTGNDVSNYTLSAQPASVTADITPKSITGATVTLSAEQLE